MAEEKGFEPLRRLLDLLVFKTSPFNRTWVFLQTQKDYNILKQIMSIIFYVKNSEKLRKKRPKVLEKKANTYYTKEVLVNKTVPAQVAE